MCCDWWEESLLEERYRQVKEQAERLKRGAETLIPPQEPKQEQKPERQREIQPEAVPV